MKIYSKNKYVKRVLAVILTIVMVLVGIDLSQFLPVQAAAEYDTLFLIDNTFEKWVKNDNAKIKAIDNSNGHTEYWMTQKDEITWSVKVPKSAYNITFNRYAEDKMTQWNSWSAGGRDKNNAYYVDGSEFGHWGIRDGSEEYFHAGDIVYLDVSEFTQWENNDAVMYVNFSDVSKEQNNGQDINLSNADSKLYNPKIVDTKIEQYIYAYVVSKDDDGKDVLRFWRGNENNLWNYSVKLEYDEYKKGNNCVKITGWDDEGSCYKGDYSFDYEKDTDGDGLTDYLEMIFGCNKHIADTDGDRLTDMQEVHHIGSDPTKYDSLVKGVSDAEVDIDEDGLSNLDELKNGTDAHNPDTDNDGLNDGKEVKEIHSDPLNEDTDGDTLKDGDDIALGFSALLADTDSNGILDCDEKVFQEISVEINNKEKDEVAEVSVSFEGTGYIKSTTSIEDIYGIDAFVSDTAGLTGVPVEITTTSKFDKATINFLMNKETVSSEEMSDLLIMWYDEENDIFVAQKTDVNVEKMTVSATVTHFSKYLLVDKKEWFKAWRNEIHYSNGIECTYDTVIAIDCSGSMSSNDRNFMYTYRDTLYPGSSYQVSTCYRKLAAENYINAKRDDDKTAIVLFDSKATVSCPLTSSRGTAILALNQIYSNGNTSFENAVKTSIDVLKEADDSSEKMILLLSDGVSSISNATLNLAVSNGIVINTVYIGSSTENDLLKNIAEQTGGQYFKAVTAEELIKIYSKISITQKIDSTDSDGDGLPDIFEIAGMKLSNGRVITTDPFVADTDGDGLSDGDEINVNPTFLLQNIFDELGIPLEVSSYVFEMNSDPTKKDSDGDGINDYFTNYDYDSDETVYDKDNRPLQKGIYSSSAKDVVTGELTIVSCTNFPLGHAFLVYRSFVNDTLDFTKLTYGYEYKTWDEMEPCMYSMGRLDYVAIGNAGAGAYGGSSNPSESGSSGSSGSGSSSSGSDRAGVYFNREFALEMSSEEKAYDENKAYSRLISEKQLQKAIEHCEKQNYYNLVENNCAIVAAGAWNAAFDEKTFKIKVLPYSLKNQIGKLDGNFVFDIRGVLEGD